MNKAQLIELISEKSGLSKSDAKKALDALISITSKSLKKGNSIELVGFGSFKIEKRNAHTVRNPRTGAQLKVPAKKIVKFKPGSAIANMASDEGTNDTGPRKE